MYVRDYMNKNVISVPPDMLINDAQQLMKQNKTRRVPVVENGKLVGMITQTSLRDAAPSQATSLSVWELNYILAKMKVSDVMTRNVITVTPDTTLEDAALLGYRHGVGALPVIEDGHMVGILTETDTFRVLLEVLGTRETGIRLRIHQHDASKKQMIGEIATVLNKHGYTIQSIFKVHAPGRPHPDVVVRLVSPEANAALEELTALGYKVETT